MLVKFTTKASFASYSDRHVTIVEAIKNIATAAAGNDPVAPSNCDTWAVLSNTTAGGWSVLTDNTTTAYGNPATYENIIRLTADTPKTSFDGIKKAVSFFTYNSNTFGLKAYAELLDSTDTAVARRYLQGATTNTTNTYNSPWCFHACDTTYIQWTVAATSEYLWIFQEDRNSDAFPSTYHYLQNRKTCGIADLSNETEWDYLEISKHVPVGGMYLTGNTNYAMDSRGTTLSSTYQSYASHNMYPTIFVLNNQDENTDALFNNLTTTSYATGQRVNPTNIAYDYSSELYNVGISSNTIRSGWDAAGNERMQAKPVTTGRWEIGETIRKMSGLYDVGCARSNVSWATQESKHGTIITVGGKNLMLFNQGGYILGVEIK